jgi:hypothetical protein
VLKLSVLSYYTLRNLLSSFIPPAPLLDLVLSYRQLRFCLSLLSVLTMVISREKNK